jgi:hypothetical protein
LEVVISLVENPGYHTKAWLSEIVHVLRPGGVLWLQEPFACQDVAEAEQQVSKMFSMMLLSHKVLIFPRTHILCKDEEAVLCSMKTSSPSLSALCLVVDFLWVIYVCPQRLGDAPVQTQAVLERNLLLAGFVDVETAECVSGVGLAESYSTSATGSEHGPLLKPVAVRFIMLTTSFLARAEFHSSTHVGTMCFLYSLGTNLNIFIYCPPDSTEGVIWMQQTIEPRFARTIANVLMWQLQL